MKKTTLLITRLLLYLFSASLALGTWNPFVNSLTYNGGKFDNVNYLAQVISALFIGSLFLFPKSNNRVKTYYIIELSLLFVILLFSTLIYSEDTLSQGTILYFIKLALDFALCMFLPRLFNSQNNYLNQSILIFSILCAIIASLFSLGLLNDFIFISQGRIFFAGENPNSTSGRFVLAFIFIIHLIIKNPFNWGRLRHLMWLLLPPIFNMIMASGSRGSFIILLICIPSYLIYAPTKGVINRIIFLLLAPIIIYQLSIYYISKNQNYSIFERLNYSIESGSDSNRGQLILESFEIFKDYPIIGAGTIKYQEEMLLRYNESRIAHNLFVYLLAVSGIIGFLLFTVFVLKVLKKAFFIRFYEPLAFTLFLYFFFLSSKTGGILTYILMWYVFAIITSYYNQFILSQQEEIIEYDNE